LTGGGASFDNPPKGQFALHRNCGEPQVATKALKTLM